ncbi:hypothetical protein BR93DRAFT_923256 [Coniochaeta sp. PMI_546]|nr:hypothetical protein BR93DRAFT_923256 [Coniochaeta sp. PMI_546]
MSIRKVGSYSKGRPSEPRRHSPYPNPRLPDTQNRTGSPARDFWVGSAEDLVTSLIKDTSPDPGVQVEDSGLVRRCLDELLPHEVQAIGKFQLWNRGMVLGERKERDDLARTKSCDPWLIKERYEVYEEKNPDIIAHQERAFSSLFKAIRESAKALGLPTVAMEAQNSLSEIYQANLAAESSEKERFEAEMARMNIQEVSTRPSEAGSSRLLIAGHSVLAEDDAAGD